MRKLSFWAAANPWKARIIIACSHVLLILLAWYTGNTLKQSGLLVPGVLLLVLTGIYFFAVYFYPRHENKQKLGKKLFYTRQKFCDLLLAATAWGMIICIANNENVRTGIFTSLNASEIVTPVKKDPTAEEILKSLEYRDKKSLTRTEKRILKKEFNVQLKKYVKAKLSGDKEGSGNAAIIILSIIAAVGLFYLLAALSCTISCNGNDAAAVIVLLLGTAGIVIGLILIFRGLKRKSRRQQEVKSTEG